MPAISFQSLFSNVTREFQVRRNESVNPTKFTQTVLQISDQQSRDKEYEKGLQYIRTYISSLQAKLNAVIEDLNNIYETMLTDGLNKKSDTKDTAKMLNRIPNADADSCSSATNGDPYALDIVPYSKNIHNYQYNPLFASKAADIANYYNLGLNNSVANSRVYYETPDQSHHELGASLESTLSYLWMWDLDRINASYATTKSEFVDAGGILHVAPTDPRLDPSSGITNIVADASLAFDPATAAGAPDVSNKLQVNVTALQPNRGVFSPQDESLHPEKHVLATLNGESTADNPDPMSGWTTTYDHSGKGTLNSPWEGLNQWNVDTSVSHNGDGSLHFGNTVSYDTHTLDTVNGGFKVDQTYATNAGYLFDPELVLEDFNGESIASLQAQGWNMGNTAMDAILPDGAPGQPGDAVNGDALTISYPSHINNNESNVVSTPSFNLSDFDSVQLTSQSYYNVQGSLHGPGCIHPAVVVQINAGGTTNTQLPNTPGHDFWSNGEFQTFTTNPPATGSTIDFNFVSQYGDGNSNATQWQIDDVMVKAKGWSSGEMISPKMDFTGYTTGYVDYWDKIDTDANFDRKEVYYCDDYDDVTGTGTWKLLDTKNGVSSQDWQENHVEIPITCLDHPENVRVKFLFDTQNSQDNANHKGWNLDDIQIYGDKPPETDFYYYRQDLDSYFVAGDGSSPLPPATLPGPSSWSSGTGDPQVTFNSGSIRFDNSSYTNSPGSVPPISPSFDVHIDAPTQVNPPTNTSTIQDMSSSPANPTTSFTMKADAVDTYPTDPYHTGGYDTMVYGDTSWDLSNAATATLTFNHFGQHATTDISGNHRKVQVSTDGGSSWQDLPIGASFDEGDFGSTSVSINLPVGSANTRVRFVGSVDPGSPLDTDTNNFWNVSGIAVNTTTKPATTKTLTRTAVSAPINTTSYSGATMSFDFTANDPPGSTSVTRKLYYSTDNGVTYYPIGTYSGSTGTITGISVPRVPYLSFKFETDIDVPSNGSISSTSGVWDINNISIKSSATDGFNVKEGTNIPNGDIAYNLNRANISFDSRESNIEGTYKKSTGAGYTPVPGRVQITNTDMPTFANALLGYVEQDAGVYNKTKYDTAAIWQGTSNTYPAQVVNLLKQKTENYQGGFTANYLNQLMIYDKDNKEQSQYMDDALAINYGYLTRKPTVASINKDDTGWVNYDPSTNWFPYLAGTKYDEGNGTYKDMSIWGKKSFIIDAAATPGALGQVTPGAIAFQDDFESGSLGGWTVNQLYGSNAVTWRDSTNTANSGSNSAYFGNAAGTSYALGPDAAERVDVFLTWNGSPGSPQDFDTHIIEPDGVDVNYTNLTHYGHLDHDDTVGADNLTDPGSGIVYDEAYHVNSAGRADGVPGSPAGNYTVDVTNYSGSTSTVNVTVVEDSGSIRGAVIHPTQSLTLPVNSGAKTPVDSFVLGASNRVAAEMISPPINLSNYTSATLSFADSFQTEAGFTGQLDKKDVYVSTDGGSTWIQLAESGSTTSSQGWVNKSYTLPPSALNNPNVKVKFVFDSVDGRQNNFRGWNIDDVKISGTQSIPPTPAIIHMNSDDDSYLYVNGYLVPPTEWVNWYKTSYQSWYSSTYSSWYATYIQPYRPGNPSAPGFNPEAPYDSYPPQTQFSDLSPSAPIAPAFPVAIPAAPPLNTNSGSPGSSGDYDIAPFLKDGFNTVAFKATEDHGGEGVTISGSAAGNNLATNSTWAVKIQPTGYDGTLSTNGVNPPGKKLTSAQIIELFQTDREEKKKLDINFSNLDQNGVGILSKIQSIDVTVRGEPTIQTYGTTTYSTSARTDDGKITAQLNNGYINGILQNGSAGSTVFDPTGYNEATGLPITDNGLQFTSNINGKADISLYFDKTANIVNDATVMVKVQYYEDSNHDGVLDATETSAANLKTKYIGMQDLRSNTAINPDSEAADPAVAGVMNRYAKDGSGNLLYNTDGDYAQQVYSNYLVAGKGRTGGAAVEGNTNKLTERLKQLIDSADFQEVLKYNLLDNIYIAATSSDNRGDQITGKLILDWDWQKRRIKMTQGSFSAVYKS